MSVEPERIDVDPKREAGIVSEGIFVMMSWRFGAANGAVGTHGYSPPDPFILRLLKSGWKGLPCAEMVLMSCSLALKPCRKYEKGSEW